MSTLVTGLYKTHAEAAAAVDRLHERGITSEDISVLMTDATHGREFGVEEHSKAPEGAAVGAATGGALGAIAAGLTAVGTLAAPGIGLLAAGPIVAALAGGGAGAAAGGLVGSLVGWGMPEHEAKFYSEEVHEGGILIGVHAHEDRVDRVKDILDATGAEKIQTA